MRDETQDSQPKLPPNHSRENQDSIELGLRFLVGLLTIGGEELAHRLQEIQRKLDEDNSLWSNEISEGEPSLSRQFWHLGIGMIQRSQMRL